MKRFLCILALITAAPAFAATLASDGSQADVAAKITAAAAGDTITLPAGSFTWSSGITVSGKGLIIQGAGSGRVVAYSASSVLCGTGTKTFVLNASGISTITVGATLRIERLGTSVSGGNPTGTRTWMQGTVTSYTGTSLVMNITSSANAVTQGAWIVITPATTTITSNVGGTMINLVEDTARNVELAGIRFLNGTNTAEFIYESTTSGGKPIFIHDCYFESTQNVDCIRLGVNRGLIWNCSFPAFPFSMAQLAIHHKDAPVGSWLATSTMGMNDSTGTSNFYVEDCDFHGWLNCVDIDDNGKMVMRHNVFNNAAFGTHGADTSNYGVRHYEVYNNTFVFNPFNDGQTLNLNWYFYLRGGTGVIANNAMPHISSTDYGSKGDVNMTCMQLQRSAGPNPLWGVGIAGDQYPAPRQVGMGRVTGTGVDGKGRSTDIITYVGDSEPLYIWNNTGSPVVTTTDFDPSVVNSDSSANYIVSGRDYFNDGTPKPGWTAYTYPHPLIATAGGGAGGGGGGSFTYVLQPHVRGKHSKPVTVSQ